MPATRRPPTAGRAGDAAVVEPAPEYRRYTDKFESGVASMYEAVLADYRDRPVNVLEMGVRFGGSLIWLRHVLPLATVYGIDVCSRPPSLDGVDVVTEVLDQVDSAGLEALAERAGGFDIVIDDASHRPMETAISFAALWKHVRPGGVYSIEDWAVSLVEFPRPDTLGMDGLVFSLAARKVELGIKALRLEVRPDFAAAALFWK